MAQCPSCKVQVEPGWTRCEYCGYDLSKGVLDATHPSQGTSPGPTSAPEETRTPRGVTAIGLIEETIGALEAALGFFFLLLIFLVAAVGGGLLVGAVAFLVGLIPVAIGLLIFYAGRALREGTPWAWKLNVAFLSIFFVVGVAEAAFGIYNLLNVFYTVAYGLMDVYLILPSTRRYFRGI